MFEPVARLRARYHELSEQSRLFIDPQSPELRIAPLQSLWREHMLSASMVQNKLYDTGRFVLIAPAANSPVHRAAATYRRHLVEDGCVSFDSITLETVIGAIGAAGERQFAERLFERYADFSELDRFI